MNLLNLMKKRGITTTDLASKLNIATSQIYYWNKHGILATNPHFKALKEIIPEVQPREPATKLNEQEDGRCRSGRKLKQLKLTDTDIPSYVEPKFVSSIFPDIDVSKILEKEPATISMYYMPQEYYDNYYGSFTDADDDNEETT